MARQVWLPDSVYEKANEIADEKDMTLKEAVRLMCRSEEGYDV